MNQITEFFHRFGLNGPGFIATTVNFVIILIVLRVFAYKPILAMLEERKKRIADGLAAAEQAKAELANTQKARQEVLNKANLDAEKLVSEARLAAARVQEQRAQEAVAQAESIIRQAREATALEHARMMSELRREVGRLVIETTAKVTGKVLTEADQRRLSEETARELAAR